MPKNIFQIIFTTLFAGILTATVIWAWTEPTVAPPTGNVTAPLNVSATAQTKSGGLILNIGGAPTGLIVDKGNVGIGTAGPTVKLDVAQNGAIKVGQAYLSSGGNYAHFANNEWYNGAAWQATAAGALIQLTGQDTNFYRHTATGGHIFSMKIDSAGNVGIGTASPGAKLDVAGQIKITGGAPGAGKVLTSDAAGLASWATPASASQWTTIGSNIYYTTGNVGIGTVSPGAKLEVAGQVKITGGTPGAGKVLTSDAAGLASWQTPAIITPAGTWCGVSGSGNNIPCLGFTPSTSCPSGYTRVRLYAFELNPAGPRDVAYTCIKN